MTYQFKTLFVSAALLAGFAVCADGQNKTPAAADAADSIVARGKGFAIKRSRLDEAVNSYKANAASRRLNLKPEQLLVVEAQLLDRLIESTILNLKATDAQKAAGREEGIKRFEMVKKHAPSVPELVQQLNGIGLTLDLLQSRLIEESTFEAVLRSRISIGDAQVKQYYDGNPADFEKPEMVRASHILLATVDLKTGQQLNEEQKAIKRKEIEALLKRARAGDSFTNLATKYSEDPGAKDTGGEYIFPRGQMVPEFEATAFSMKPDQISEVITTQFGYHIIKMSEKIPAHKMSLDEVKTRLKNYLEQREIDRMMPNEEEVPKFFVDLKKDNAVEILDPVLKAAEEKLGVSDDKNPPKAK